MSVCDHPLDQRPVEPFPKILHLGYLTKSSLGRRRNARGDED